MPPWGGWGQDRSHTDTKGRRLMFDLIAVLAWFYDFEQRFFDCPLDFPNHACVDPLTLKGPGQ